MRLLNVHTLEFEEFLDESKRPKYAIASHRWNGPFETNFKSVLKKRNVDGLGYQKVSAFTLYVKEIIPSIDWLWIDTCCIDKDSAAELSKSINLMFEWYRNAHICLAYLADVADVEDHEAFAKSEWFTRGWTLQELLAPRTVLFLSRTWDVIGIKGNTSNISARNRTGISLEQDIARITGLPEQVLHDFDNSLKISVEDRLKWMDHRTTTLAEDMFYALFGIFNVTPGVNYGERGEGAKRRLLSAIDEQKSFATLMQSNQMKAITDWLSPPDPGSNHASARHQHEDQTGTWLLQSEYYRRWKGGGLQHLWIHGKPGCGKTVLCSTVIEDIQIYCQTNPHAESVMFYFAFSDDHKQSCEDLMRSVIAQLAWKEPTLSMLRQMYEQHTRGPPKLEDLERAFISSIDTQEMMFLMLDALDESPIGDIRQKVLDQLESLARRSTKLKLFVTSREIHDVRISMESLKAMQINVATNVVDNDIRRYISKQLSCDRTLSRRLNAGSKAMIEQTLMKKADGMFRWVFCQLHELKKLEDFRPSYIRETLKRLPGNLEDTYSSMLGRIRSYCRADALKLLYWLAYAHRPLTLSELVDAVTINVQDEIVNLDDRGTLDGPLNILSGFVTTLSESKRYYVGLPRMHELYLKLIAKHRDTPRGVVDDGTETVNPQTRVQIAHFSILEFLESERIQDSGAKSFSINLTLGHHFIAQSCMTYITHYSQSAQKTRDSNDLEIFPLLRYAATSWFYHASLHQSMDASREITFLTCAQVKMDWSLAYDPDYETRPLTVRGKSSPAIPGSALYYSTLLGLKRAVEVLLEEGFDVNVHGGRCSNALQASLQNDHLSIAELLINSDADIHAPVIDADLDYPHPQDFLLSEKIEELRRPTKISAPPSFTTAPNHEKPLMNPNLYIDALYTASQRGHAEIVKLLFEKGACVNMQGGKYGNALQAASQAGHLKILMTLLENGADVNALGGHFNSALQAAAHNGYYDIVNLLLEVGANIHASGGWYGTALQAAALRGFYDIVKLLLEAGADIDAASSSCGSALYVASEKGHTSIVKLLLERGANVNVRSGRDRSALQAAIIMDRSEIVKLLREHGAEEHPVRAKHLVRLPERMMYGRGGPLLWRLLKEKSSSTIA